LMDELIKLVPVENILYNTQVVSINHDDDRTNGVDIVIESYGSSQSRVLKSRLIIGADGVHSLVRRLTLPKCSVSVRYCKEMCYRGVFNLDHKNGRGLYNILQDLLTGIPHDTMLITYGRGLRASFGLIDGGKRSKGYWWIKQASEDISEKPNTKEWPESFKKLYEMTPTQHLYCHEIVDSKTTSERISSSCSVLIGDAAHPVTPNMGQGACMAVEDALVLCTLIGKFSHYPDGDVEAFYQYEKARRTHVNAVAKSSHIQAMIGQLKDPILVWIRDNVLYNLPSAVFVKTLRRNNFDIDPFLDSFLNQTSLAEG
jgi:2-polyprenyl-6-methoxyphenol hydroxylase-like FAD-dependent oxidoreductase